MFAKTDKPVLLLQTRLKAKGTPLWKMMQAKDGKVPKGNEAYAALEELEIMAVDTSILKAADEIKFQEMLMVKPFVELVLKQ